MIVRQFIVGNDCSGGERAEATRSLARALLFSDCPTTIAAPRGRALMLLDDAFSAGAPAMAEVFSRNAEAPAASCRRCRSTRRRWRSGGSSFAAADRRRPGRHHRPPETANAMRIARRINLPAAVCAAIAEVGTPRRHWS